jgi:iron complex transport system ATP-binding protein
MTTVLAAHNLSIGYRADCIVADGINVSLQSGELVCLIGPNGIGKSTLMRTLAGMQKPLAGGVTLMNDDIHNLSASERARRLSVVLTGRAQVGLLTGYEVTALGRHPHTDWTGHLSAYDEQVVRWAVKAVDAQSLAHRRVAELSDGERQKFMVARALAQEPAVMILDEPTAFLDLPRRVEIMRLLRRLASETDRAILLSTHDLDLALRSAHKLWLMSGDGMEVGAPEDLVLSGALQRTFRGEGISFDMQSGSFTIERDNAGCVSVLGEGLAAIWISRALEREGFVTQTNGSPPLATITIDDETHWTLTVGEHHTQHTTIANLLADLRQFIK